MTPYRICVVPRSTNNVAEFHATVEINVLAESDIEAITYALASEECPEMVGSVYLFPLGGNR